MIIYCIQYYKHNEISNKNTYDDANLVVDKLLLGKSNLLNNGVCSPMLLLLYDIFCITYIKTTTFVRSTQKCSHHVMTNHRSNVDKTEHYY